VRKLNILEEAPASFAVVHFGVTSPLSSKLAYADFTYYTERTEAKVKNLEGALT
jgi:hypothetical protein